MTYQPIACGDYDQLELYCLRANEVQVTLVDGCEFTATAKDVGIVKGEGEWLHFHNHSSVRLDHIKAISLA